MTSNESVSCAKLCLSKEACVIFDAFVNNSNMPEDVSRENLYPAMIAIIKLMQEGHLANVFKTFSAGTDFDNIVQMEVHAELKHLQPCGSPNCNATVYLRSLYIADQPKFGIKYCPTCWSLRNPTFSKSETEKTATTS